MKKKTKTVLVQEHVGPFTMKQNLEPFQCCGKTVSLLVVDMCFCQSCFFFNFLCQAQFSVGKVEGEKQRYNC